MGWLARPYFDDPEVDQRAAIIWFTLCMCGGIWLVQAATYVVLPTMAYSGPYLIPEGLGIGAAFLALRSGHVRLPGLILTTLFTVMITAFIFLGGGLEYSFPPLMGTIAIMGALMLGARAGMVLTLWTVVCLIGVLIFGSSDILIIEGQEPQDALFTIQLITVLLGGGLVTYSVHRLSQALATERAQTALANETVERLDHARRFTEGLVQSMADAVLVVSADGEVIQANDAAVKLYGLAAAEQMIGESLTEFLDEADLARLTGTNTPGSRAVGDAVIRANDGLVVPVRIARSSLRSEDARTLQVFVLADIRIQVEAQQRSEEAARAANAASRAKSQFLANMSHELRTPLNAVIGYSDMLLDDVEDPTIVADIGRIRQAGKHLLSLINDVLDMSKIEAGRMEVFVEPVRMAPLIDEVESQIANEAHRRGNTVTIELPDPDLTLHSDSRKLKQILLNLASNAVKFTENGTVRIVAERVDDELQLSVIDTGIGISDAQLEGLFEPFVQADDSTQRRYGGTGLGLALSRRFATLLGGQLRAMSRPGLGSTFTLTVPVGHATHTTLTPRSQVDEGQQPLVLCVDDDPATLDLYARLFRRQGLRVAVAGSGADALIVAKRHRPAVITLDVMMPEMDGWTLLSRLREDPELRTIPVVMVSMVDDGETTALSLGAADYLVKPVEPSRMVSTIRRYLVEGTGRVLVVDDQEDIRHLLRRLLSGEGWTVECASGSEEGLEMLGPFKPDLIVLDLMMPDLDGFGFIERIRADARFRHTPIVVHTSMDLNRAQWEELSAKTAMVVPKSGNGLQRMLQEVRRFAVPT